MSASVDSHALRAIIIKLQDYLTDDDRQRLHFFLGSDVPKSIRDNPSLTGTLELVESLFQQDKINENDFTFLIDAFDEIRCFDAVKILREYRREMQDNGQFESIRSLTSILLQDLDEDKIARENITCSLTMNNQRNNYGNNNVLVDNKTTNINPMNIFVEKPSTKRKSLWTSKKFWSMWEWLLMIGFSVAICACIIKINILNQQLKEKDEIIAKKSMANDESSSSCQNRSRPFDISLKLHKHHSKRNGITILGKDDTRDAFNQVGRVWHFCVDDDQTIYAADEGNHRIIARKKNATTTEIVAGGNGPGAEDNQLHFPVNVLIDYNTDSFIIADYGNRRVVRWPRLNGTNGETIISDVFCWGLAIDREGYIYVSDEIRSTVKRWRIGQSEGVIVAGGNGEGYRRHQLNIPRSIFIDEDESLYVSDCHNHRVMKWSKGAKFGIVVAGGRGSRNELHHQLLSPHGIIVDRSGALYIADYGNDRVVRWLEGAKQGEIIAGGNVRGHLPNQFNGPADIAFDRQNNLYVLDSNNHRIQKFFLPEL